MYRFKKVIALTSILVFSLVGQLTADLVYFGYSGIGAYPSTYMMSNPLLGYYDTDILKFLEFDFNYAHYNPKTGQFDSKSNVDFYKNFNSSKTFTGIDSKNKKYKINILKYQIPVLGEMQNNLSLNQYPPADADLIFWSPNIDITLYQPINQKLPLVIRNKILALVDSEYKSLSFRDDSKIIWSIKINKAYKVGDIDRVFVEILINTTMIDGGFKSVKSAFFILHPDDNSIVFKKFSNPYEGPGSENYNLSVVPQLFFKIAKDNNIYSLIFQFDGWEWSRYAIMNMKNGKVLITD